MVRRIAQDGARCSQRGGMGNDWLSAKRQRICLRHKLRISLLTHCVVYGISHAMFVVLQARASPHRAGLPLHHPSMGKGKYSAQRVRAHPRYLGCVPAGCTARTQAGEVVLPTDALGLVQRPASRHHFIACPGGSSATQADSRHGARQPSGHQRQSLTGSIRGFLDTTYEQQRHASYSTAESLCRHVAFGGGAWSRLLCSPVAPIART